MPHDTIRLHAFRITLAHQLAMLGAGINPGDFARELREFHFTATELLAVSHDALTGELEVYRINVKDVRLSLMPLGQPHVSGRPQ